jgi:hypothetical protein
MTKVRQQILDVMRIVYNEWKLHPEGAAIQLSQDKLRGFPSHNAILRKLAEQYKVIEIEQIPDHREMQRADHDMFANERPSEYKRYMSYLVRVSPKFEEFYQKHYADNSVNIPSLNTKNFFIVLDTAELIDDKINISPSNTVVIKGSETGSYIFKGPFKNLSHYEIAQHRKSGLEFLKGQNALTSIQVDAHEETDFGQDYEVIDGFTIEVNRPVFAEAYEELLRLLDKHLGISEKVEPETESKHTITFDVKNERLRDGDNTIDINSGTIEYYILKALYSVPIGQGVSVEDVVEQWGGSENKQTLYDAVSRLNKKFRHLLGTTSKDTKVVFQKTSKIYFDKQYSDSISTQK